MWSRLSSKPPQWTSYLPVNGLLDAFSIRWGTRQRCLLLPLLFFFFSIYFNWRIITLQYCDGFAMHQIWIGHRCTCVPSILNPPSRLPPHCIHLGCSKVPALGALLHASNLHWSHILYMVMYMFKCYSLNSFHPRLLPLSPKVCSLYLCLFAALHVGLSVLSLVFSILLDAPAKKIRQEKK